jgi:MATE family multidrug resistance protein
MKPFGQDVHRVLRLAVPVALGELGWMAMTTVDTIMVGKLGAAAIGAIGVGNSAFYSFAIFGMGLLLGLDTLVSQSCGAGDREDCHRSLTQGVYLAFALTGPLMLLFHAMPPIFRLLGIVEPVSSLASIFIRVLNLSTLPLLLYGAFRRYLQGMGHVAPVMFALVSANLVNWFFNWVLIEGHWGFPALGVAGSALSTCFARLYMAAALAAAIWWYERGLPPGFRNLLQPPDWQRLGWLIRLGFPAASQILLEIGAFGAAAVLAGRLTPVALAAHQIALNCAALSFMVPLGISSAAAVAVGHAVGAGEFAAARRRGFIAIGLACSFMACSAIAFLLFPEPILRIYTSDAVVLRTGVGLLAIAALFQLFDGTQTVATGALRGIGETRGPMLANLAGYWMFGIPIGYALCFHFGLGVYGLWWGLTLALVLISLVLLGQWARRSSVVTTDLEPEPARSS